MSKESIKDKAEAIHLKFYDKTCITAKSHDDAMFLAKQCAIESLELTKKEIAEYSDYDMSKEGQSAMWDKLNELELLKIEIEKL